MMTYARALPGQASTAVFRRRASHAKLPARRRSVNGACVFATSLSAAPIPKEAKAAPVSSLPIPGLGKKAVTVVSGRLPACLMEASPSRGGGGRLNLRAV